MTGIVYKSTGSWYSVKGDDGKFYNARIKGVFKIDDITSTNPIAVGDAVEFETENEGEASVIITKIGDRKNYVARQSPRAKHAHHIVAANLDQSLMLATIKEPRTSQGFIDRFLVACEMYHVPAIVVFNKTDVYKEKDWKEFERLKTIYEAVGYKAFAMSLKERKGLDEIKETLKEKTTLISGHSGVGKSSFINAVIPDSKIKTQDVSGWSGKGQHTTTFAEMYDLPFDGKLIDTPGMREFGLVDVKKEELSGYFPEMRARLNDCQFNNCQHINEPGCAIKQAVIDGEIDEDRYVSYVNILESLKDHEW
ncbi:ribosome small subunit-dependent GTPase A [Flavisolibacter ginsenosidimutans]|uniref:Small ribosomal subunit biogenesis GTPase RsgA n=1 Tax=Flavisolibacter ginsenosidimutans TaxID=661481 RepID=A0A5B8UL14_9BACT|nr:ribosome small subunit-dependent GTPase A [Flavisolibacter ginsenosidimutans]QEC57391.1 ribosome small subunit-dependent GTPase A [Flavisolibacter ginsenosidimutans]